MSSSFEKTYQWVNSLDFSLDNKSSKTSKKCLMGHFTLIDIWWQNS
jgi:hypothetical protein